MSEFLKDGLTDVQPRGTRDNQPDSGHRRLHGGEVMYSNYTVFSPLTFDETPFFEVVFRPYPRKVSQKERRRKARRLRSNGIRVMKGAK